jgi:hypothetical protein
LATLRKEGKTSEDILEMLCLSLDG